MKDADERKKIIMGLARGSVRLAKVKHLSPEDKEANEDENPSSDG